MVRKIERLGKEKIFGATTGWRLYVRDVCVKGGA